MHTLEKISDQRLFAGRQIRYAHDSAVLNCRMQFSVYLPPQSEQQPVPALYWLSGLTCTDENFSAKSGAQRVAAELGLALVIPDTSPRGEGVPDDPEGAYDFGLGAGFYVNATQAPYQDHYQMYDYISRELPALAEADLPISTQRAIFGHSMGGHGALVMALREPYRYRSVSAFAPICNPVNCPWGRKALAGYLGNDESQWQDYDASMLLAKRKAAVPILVDQGDADQFLAEQLKPDTLQAAGTVSGSALELRMQPGYDHSYYFVATFIEEHLRFHARYLLP
ncbi:S-formylglutathione hydrolase [Natronospirillum operosum]|uniref:S-formylglutathione hydrolase n=1 Tax=Natronospirillum operosum TaxID=2759953 RepID=A0A4Z0W5F5_9GAMM|nr:S-formylglutathione hydrolase [Natronospirillum operosum]TGG92882.1 S-formylglutathione hydrolase [Natronospirillum operosum]